MNFATLVEKAKQDFFNNPRYSDGDYETDRTAGLAAAMVCNEIVDKLDVAAKLFVEMGKFGYISFKFTEYEASDADNALEYLLHALKEGVTQCMLRDKRISTEDQARQSS